MKETFLHTEIGNSKLSHAQRALVEAKLPWANKVGAKVAANVRSVARSGALDPEDLQSEAVLGLCEAARTFDPEKGVDFEAYAQQRVRGAPMDAVRAVTPHGRKAWDDACAVETQLEAHTQLTGFSATTAQLAEALAVEEAAIERARRTWHQARPARLAIDDAEPRVLEMAERDAPGDDAHVTAIVVDQELDKLPHPDRTLIVERYVNDRTQAAVAREMGISEARVCQREGTARSQLRSLLEADGVRFDDKAPAVGWKRSEAS
jgi:RNA polymerase sigma factor for flagellar operon FliA